MSPAPSIHSIQATFRAVDLPLCDDRAAVEEASDRLRATRNRELNSTKGTVAAKAQAWFDDVDTLLNRREPLLQAGYEHFAGLARSILSAASAAERKRLARRARKALLPLATEWCGARDDLAKEWIQRFAAEHKLQLEEQEADQKAAAKAGRRGGARGQQTRGQKGPEGKALPGRRLALAVVGALALAVGLGGTLMEGGLAGLGELVWAPTDAAARSADDPAETGPPSLVADTHTAAEPAVTEPDPVATAATLPDEPVAADESDEPAPPPTPWQLGLHAPPTQAYAGQMLVLRLDCERRPADEEPLELALQGLVLRDFDVDGQPPALRVSVKELPEGESEGEARWTVRLRDRDGQLSTLLEGGCKVVPGE